jgi:chitosanase
MDTSFIKKVLLAFEQSSTQINYDTFYYYNDGPKKIKQITVSFGITEFGNLKALVEDYLTKGGKVTKLKDYLPKIGKEQLVNDYNFIALLKEACKEDLMKDCQEYAYDKFYIIPALTWCDKNKLVTPLSKLVIADSYLHSGSILTFLRNRFSEKVPASGGDEKKWIESYVNVRHEWLKNHENKILNNTVYRMNFMKDLIAKNDWNLSSSQYNANGVIIKA